MSHKFIDSGYEVVAPEPYCGICGVCESWHARTGCDQWKPDTAATPEAQIPECVQAPERRVLIVDSGSEALRLLVNRNRALESQLAALRVERDRAQEEADVMDNALKYAIDYLSGGRRLTEDPLSEIKKRLLARPIPAEPGEKG